MFSLFKHTTHRLRRHVQHVQVLVPGEYHLGLVGADVDAIHGEEIGFF